MNAPLLYGLDEDIGETKDPAEEIPEKTTELRDRLHQGRNMVTAQLPSANRDYDSQRGGGN